MYLLDSNVFIQAKNLHYGFDICPGFWDWIDAAFADGRVLSIEKVREELEAGKDGLADWVRRRPAMFKSADAGVVASLRQLSVSATSCGRYQAGAVTTFLGAADAYLVAHGAAHQLTVVTHEAPGNSSRRIKIPDACVGLGVSYCSVYAMLRQEGAEFVLPQ